LWQEVWDSAGPASTRRRARQEIAVIVIDPNTGDQFRLSHQTKYYTVDRGESLVDAYERLGGPVAPPMEVFVPSELFSNAMLPALSTPAPAALDPEALVSQIADGGVRCDACRRALHQLASELAAPLAGENDLILRNIAGRPRIIAYLRSELNKSNLDAAWILGSLPDSVNVPRAEILEDLFWRAQPSSNNGESEPLLGAWTRMADLSSPNDYVLFVQRVFRSQQHVLDAAHASEVLKRLPRRRYRELIENDDIILQELADYFKDVVRLADPNTVNPIITVMASLNKAPEIQDALQKGLRELATVPIEPFKNPSFEWIKEERVLLRWAISYFPVQPDYDKNSTLKELLIGSLEVDPQVDPDVSEAINIRIDEKAKEEGSRSLTRLFKELMTGVDGARLLPGEFRMVPPLLDAMDRRLAESVQIVQEDADFRDKLLRYVGLAIGRASPGPEEALRLLDDLIRTDHAGDLFGEVVPVLQDGLAKIKNTGSLTQHRKSLRIRAIRAILNHSLEHPS
jgi:hypothetical protein